jgi:glycosyltransferase involved in cell wall biosynthesis
VTKIAFIMEIGLGHTTIFKNFQTAVEKRPDIQATWLPITFERSGILARIPKVRNDIVFRAGVQAYFKLKKEMRAQKFDVLFFHTQMPSVFCHGFMGQIPTVVSIDATPKQFLDIGKFYGLKSDINTPLERRRDRWYRRAFTSSAKVVTFSQWAADSVVADYGVAPANVQVFTPGVDLNKWKPGYARDRNEVRLLFVGGELKRKGGDLLLRWMRECAPANCTLDVVTRDKVPETARTTVHNDLNSNDPRLISLYQNADLFVMPTRSDCSPNVLAEAMAAGVPVLSTNITSIPEMVLKYGGDTPAGLLVPAGDWPAFESALTDLTGNPQTLRAMAVAARQRAEARYDGHATMTRELDMLCRLARPESIS